MSLFPLPSTDPLGTDVQMDQNGDLVLAMSGDLQTVSGADNVTQALRVNIATAPYTYLWDDPVGTDLSSYVDDPITTAMENQIIAMVTEKAQEDDRIQAVSQVTVDDSQPNALVVFVSAVVDDSNVQTSITAGGA